MDKANEIITKIIKEVLTALYQPFGAAVLMAFVSMFVFLYAKEHGWKKSSLIKNIFGTWFKNFKESSTFRRAFLLVFYSTMILFRTILNRDIWFNPLDYIMGDGDFIIRMVLCLRSLLRIVCFLYLLQCFCFGRLRMRFLEAM